MLFVSSFRPRTTSMLLVSALALGACAGAPRDTASMLNGGPDYTSGPIASTRPVEMIAISPANIGQFAGAEDQTGGWTYRLGVGDIVQLFVVDAPELTMPGGAEAGYRIEADGMVQVPFLGRVAADGLSLDALRAELAQRLTQYMAAPQVDVRVTTFNARHVAVVGAVARPNRQTLTTTPLTAIDAINAAGGFAAGAENDRVVLIRNGAESDVDVQGFMTQGRATPVLRDGDVLRIGGRASAAAGRAAPQTVRLHLRADGPREIALGGAGVSLTQLLASGAMPGAGETVYVLRAAAGGQVQALTLDAASVFDPALGGRLALRPGDSVVVAAVEPTLDPMQRIVRLTPALRAMQS